MSLAYLILCCSHSRYKEAAVCLFVIGEKCLVWLHCSHLVYAVSPKQLKLDILDSKETFSMIEVMFFFCITSLFHIYIFFSVPLCLYLHFIPHYILIVIMPILVCKSINQALLCVNATEYMCENILRW